MRVLIVEDETSSYKNLVSILREIAPDIEVAGNTESVGETVRWLETNAHPDLIFMDIHLSDDSAFAIFHQTEVTVPIVFTTAYDQYALDAFQVNSIDYLLKPVKAKDVQRAIDKFHRLSHIDLAAYLNRMATLVPEESGRGKEHSSPNTQPSALNTQLSSLNSHHSTLNIKHSTLNTQHWQQRLLIGYRDALMPVNVADIAFIYSTEKTTAIYQNNGEQLSCHKSLESILSKLDPHQFFRANKQFAVNRDSVEKITVWYDSRLLVTLTTPTPERLFVSKNRAAEFKQWMVESV